MSVIFSPIDLFTIDWPAQLSKINGFPVECLAKHHHVTCPICETPKAFRFSDYQGEGNWICKVCGAGKGPRLLHEVLGMPYVEVFKVLKGENVKYVPIERQRSVALCNELSEEDIAKNKPLLKQAWCESKWMRENDAAWRYLQKRIPFVDLSRLDRSIRLHRKMALVEEVDKKYVLRGAFPTMLAVVKDSKETFITLHRTFLTNNGTKVPYEMSKKQMGGVRKLKGAGINLVTNKHSRTLAVGEGIETMLAIAVMHHYKINVRSYLNAGNLSVADIPRAEFDKVIIYADHDKLDREGKRPGEFYARKLYLRLIEMGFEVEIRLPKIETTDWADYWLNCTNLLGDIRQRLLSLSIQRQTDNPVQLVEEMLNCEKI